jgi:hypothetical protein
VIAIPLWKVGQLEGEFEQVLDAIRITECKKILANGRERFRQ